MKKALSLFLALVMVIGMIPMAVLPTFAEASDGVSAQAASNNIVEVYNDNDGDSAKITFASLIGKTLTANTTYKLMENIDLEDKQLKQADKITLADGVIFDGNGYSITNFDLTVGKETALFTCHNGTAAITATIKDVTFGSDTQKIKYVHDGETYNGYIGFALINQTGADDTLILSGLTAYVDGACKGGAWQDHAVFLGRNNYKVTIDNCKAYGSLKGHGYLGAFIGQNASEQEIEIKNSVNYTSVTSDGSRYYGGFIGYNSKTASKVKITNCINNGAINGAGYIGGFIGYADSTSIEIKNSVNNGVMTGANNGSNSGVGGFIGTLATGTATITSCVNAGTVTGTTTGIGGFIGKTTADVTVDNSVNSGSIKGTSAVGGFVGEFATAGKTATIKNGSMNKGNVEATGICAGGAIGKADLMSGTINVSDFFNSGNVTSTSSAGGVLGRAEPGKEKINGVDVEKDNSALKITIDRLVNTGTIIGKWRGCAATGYIQKATVSINNSISTGKTQYYGNTNPKYYADSFAFADKGKNTGNVTGSGNYYISGNTLGDGFGETKGTISDILAVLNAENSPYVHGPYASNYNGGNANNIVLATPEFEGYQTGTTVTDNKVKIRLLATIDDVNLLEGSCEYTYLGFKITVDGTVVEGKIEGGEVIWSSQQYVYTSILANEGGKEVTYTAEQFGGKYIYAEVLELDATKAHTIYVQTFASNKNINNPEEKDLYFGGTYTINIPVAVSAN